MPGPIDPALEKRMSALSDAELARLLTVYAQENPPEVFDAAEAEANRRGLAIEQPFIPVPEAKPPAAAKPGAKPKPTPETKPVPEAKPATQAKPAEKTKPVTETKPAVETKPDAKPTAKAKPVTEATPVAETKAPPAPSAGRYQAGGLPIMCGQCRNTSFEVTKLDWLSRTAVALVCSNCGLLQIFTRPPEPVGER